MPPADPTVALVGCPNVGKSVLFSALADTYADVSNYPGTTLDVTRADLGDAELVDSPGVYGISSFNEEERVARDVVLDADAVVNVVSATNLDRDLFLTLQLLDMGKPTAVALNMMDEAESDGLSIDVDALADRLGVPVVPTVALTGDGVEDLRAAIPDATAPDETPLDRWADELPDDVDATRAERTLLLEGDEATAQRLAAADGDTAVADGGAMMLPDDSLREEIYTHRRSRVRDVLDAVVTRGDRTGSLADRLDDLLLRPLTGTPIALGVLGLIYVFIGDLVAQRLVDFMEVEVFAGHYIPFVQGVVRAVLPETAWAEPVRFVLLNGDLGLLTITVQYLVGVLLPLVMAFYLSLSVLEDSGVLPRLAVLTDRGMTRIGLNGRAIIPMIVGVGCVTMAIITTRMVGTKRDRVIATALLGLAIPCSAQLGVILGLLAGLGIWWWFGYLGVLVAVLGIAGVALDRALPGDRQALVTELPRLRLPRPRNVLRKTANRSRMFLVEATPLFAVTAVGVSALEYAGGLSVVERVLVPFTSMVGMPTAFAKVLILGLIRRDFAAAGMTGLAITPGQTFVGLVVITLFVPCILSMLMIFKEHDLKTGVVMWLGSWVVAFTVGGLLAAVVL